MCPQRRYVGARSAITYVLLSACVGEGGGGGGGGGLAGTLTGLTG